MLTTVERTREKILSILRAEREVTVDDLTRSLDLAPATVRRHLDILQRDGYVAVRPVRRETGRPHYVFSPTHAGESPPQHYIRLSARLVDELVSLRPEDTSGRDGAGVTGLVFDRLVEGLERAVAPKVTASTLTRRIAQTVAVLADEGLAFDVAGGSGSVLLVGRDCPCRRIAGRDPEACRHDERLLERLLGARVERAAPAEAFEGCAYLVIPGAPRSTA